MFKDMKHYKTKTSEDFERLQSSYSKAYFELYKKYYKEKEKIKRAIEYIKENEINNDLIEILEGKND